MSHRSMSFTHIHRCKFNHVSMYVHVFVGKTGLDCYRSDSARLSLYLQMSDLVSVFASITCTVQFVSHSAIMSVIMFREMQDLK